MNKIIFIFFLTILVGTQLVSSAVVIEFPTDTSVSVITGNLTSFLQLLDTPGSYAGDGGDCVKVNVGETALEFGSCGTGTADGNASSICAGDQVLLGNGTCQPSSQFFDDTNIIDTSAYVNCTGDEAFLGNGSCISSASLGGGADNVSWNESYARELFAQNTTTGVQLLINSTMVLFSKIFSLDWTNATITESQISDLSHTIDTSAYVNCTGGEAFLGNGTCQDVAQYFDDTDTQKKADDNYLYNDTDTIYYNETKLNDTIDARASGIGDNASWNQSGANELYAPNTTTGIQVLINNTMVVFTKVFSEDWTNITLTESQISDLVHTTDSSASVNCSGGEAFLGNGSCQDVAQYFDDTDTNESLRMENITSYDCGGTDKAVGHYDNGTVKCATDQTGAGGKNTNNFYLFNDSSTIFFNETQLNDTIDLRDSDTITIDTSAYVNCSTGEIFLGNGSCMGIDIYLSTFNDSYAGSLNNASYLEKTIDTSAYVNCSTDEVLLGNGSCLSSATLGGGNASWNESYAREFLALNTTTSIQVLINNTMMVFTKIFSEDWTNVTITESQISDLAHTVDTSAYINCTGGEAFLGNGTCQPVSQYFDDTDTDTWFEHDQDLNTTDNVTFVNLTLTGQFINGVNISNVSEGNHTIDTDTNFSNCGDGEYGDGTGNCIHFNDTVKLLFAEEQVVYNASMIEVETGTLDSGDLTSILQLDGETYNVSEVTGTPGFMININFTNIVNFNVVALRGRYEGGAGHTLALELYRVGVGWEERHELTDQSDFGVTTFDVFIGSDFIDGDGTVQFRINHDDNGINTHDYFLDFIVIGQVTGLISGGDLGDLTGRDNACALLPTMFCIDGSRNATNISVTNNISASWILAQVNWSWIQNFPAFVLNNSIVDFSQVFSEDWSNVTIQESQITDLAHTIDTSAYVNCSTGEVFLGNGSCMGVDIYLSTYNVTYAGSLNNASYLSTYNVSYANNASYLSTYNATYDGYPTTLNETDLVLGVNTTSNIQNLLNNTMMIFTKVFSLDWTNITITESQISDLVHTTDSSASVNCSTGDVFLGNGSCMGALIYLSTYNVSYDGSLNNASYLSTYNVSYANNASYLSTYNATYDGHAEMDYTNVALINKTNIFAGKQNFTNVTFVGGDIYSNATCVITAGATATFYVC